MSDADKLKFGHKHHKHIYNKDSNKKDNAFIPSIEPKVTSANIPTNQING